MYPKKAKPAGVTRWRCKKCNHTNSAAADECRVCANKSLSDNIQQAQNFSPSPQRAAKSIIGEPEPVVPRLLPLPGHFNSPDCHYNPQGVGRDGDWDRIVVPRVIAISNNLTENLVLERAVQANVGMVIYDSRTISLQSLLERIQRAAGPTGTCASVALIDHGDSGEFRLTDGLVVNQQSLQHPEVRGFFQGLASIIQKGGRFDILGCNVVSNGTGQELIKSLESLMGLSIAANKNFLGGLGDFNLERGQVDSIMEYFDLERLRAWKGHAFKRNPGGSGVTRTQPNLSQLQEANIKPRHGRRSGREQAAQKQTALW